MRKRKVKGFHLGGRHWESIDELIDFLKGYLKKMYNVELTRLHTIYFALKLTTLQLAGKSSDWESVLGEVVKDIELESDKFKAGVDELTRPLKEEVLEKIRRGEIV